MELQQKLDLVFDVDAVLRGQGADPLILRSRRPRLVEIAEKARQDCQELLQPRVVYKVFPLEGIMHERLILGDGQHLQGKLPAQHLATASEIIVILATIGDELEEHVRRVWEADMVYALALDGAGSVAVEALANAACQFLETRASEKGLKSSIPLSPGMVDWTVAEGQPQIFQLLGEEGSIVSLTSSAIMVPKKSLTMVMGIGAELKSAGRMCDYCAMRETCRYQDHYTAAN